MSTHHLPHLPSKNTYLRFSGNKFSSLPFHGQRIPWPPCSYFFPVDAKLDLGRRLTPVGIRCLGTWMHDVTQDLHDICTGTITTTNGRTSCNNMCVLFSPLHLVIISSTRFGEYHFIFDWHSYGEIHSNLSWFKQNLTLLPHIPALGESSTWPLPKKNSSCSFIHHLPMVAGRCHWDVGKNHTRFSVPKFNDFKKLSVQNTIRIRFGMTYRPCVIVQRASTIGWIWNMQPIT